jgi:hypothetical protein
MSPSTSFWCRESWSPYSPTSIIEMGKTLK